MSPEYLKSLFEDYLPPWAARTSDGNPAEIGAVLPTRDGRYTGNAVVVAKDEDEGTLTIITDAGSVLREMTLEQINRQFHPPMLISRDPLPAVKAALSKNPSLHAQFYGEKV